MKKRILFLIATLFLCALSACGTANTNQNYISEATSYYTAIHNIPQNTSGITTGEASDGLFFYVTNEAVMFGVRAIPYPVRMIAIDPVSGKTVLYQSFRGKLEAYLSERKQECTALIGAAADSTGNISAAVCFSDIYDGFPVAYLVSLDSDGNVLWDLSIDSLFYLHEVQNMFRTDEGMTCLLSGNGNFLVVDADGNQVYSNNGDFHHMTRLSNGQVVLFRQKLAGTEWEVLTPDLENSTMQTLCALPCLQEGDPRNGGFYTGNSEYDLFCATDLSLYGIKLGTEDKMGTATQILSWVNCDVDGTGILAFTAVDDKNFSVLTYSADLGADLAFLEWHETDPYAEKTTLTIACRQLPEALSRAIQKFNRQSADCRIVIRDYTTVSAEGIDRLTADLNAGNMPDLFCMEGVDEQTLVNREYLEDLWSYIDNDAQLGRDALVEPVFNAMSIDGKLYTVTRGFTLETTLGLKALVGEEPGWSFAEFAELAKDNPDLETLGNIYYDRDYALDRFLDLYIGNYIDWAEGTASFDSPEFIEAMEYLMLYPEEINRKRGDAPLLWLTEGKQLFSYTEIARVNDYDREMITTVSRKENAVWKGYPGLGGNGSVFRPQLQLAMASNGKNKEAAWSFLRTLLLPENQDFDRPGETATVHSLPTNKAVFDEMVQAYVDQWNANFALYVINRYEEDVEVERWTQEDIDAFYALIEGATVVVRPQETISAILRDEINRFFAGQQDAQTAAKAIQNRVQLCLDEQS